MILSSKSLYYIYLSSPKWCPFKGQVDTGLLTSGVQVMISGRLPGTETSPVTQQNCNIVGRVDQLWGVGQAVMSIVLFL